MNRRSAGRLMVPLAAVVLLGPLAAVRASAVVGEPTADQAFRFVAKVDVGTAADGGRSCTGALVAPQWVVTAKACFTEAGAPPAAGPPPRPSRAIVGRLDLTGTTGYSATVTSLVPHPTRDVVLAKLASRITDITPVPFALSAPTVGETVHVVGFGRTHTDWVPDAPRLARFTVQTATDSQVTVAGATTGASLCKGDAGGPALRVVNGQSQLLAINRGSWQGGCLGNESETNTGGIQTRVDDIADWILDTVADPVQPSVAYNPVSGNQELYAIASNGHLYQRVWKSGVGWSTWDDLGGALTGKPVAVHNPVAGTQEVYAVGTNGHLFQRSWKSGTGWSNWADLAGVLTSAPAAAYNPFAGTQEVYGLGTTANLHQRNWRSGSGWSNWINLGATLTRDPVAVENPVADTREVYAVGTNGHVFERYWSAGAGWSNWVDLAGVLAGSPAVAHNPVAGSQEVYGVGTTAHVFQRYWRSGTGWSKWIDLGGTVTGTPAVVSNPVADTQEVYALGTDGHLYERYWRAAGWQAGWIDLGGSKLTGTPVAVHNPVNQNQELYLGGTDGHVYARMWDPGTGWTNWLDLGAPGRTTSGSGQLAAGESAATVISTTAAVTDSIVEDFGYPNAAGILAQRGINLYRGDGHIVMVDCGPNPNSPPADVILVQSYNLSLPGDPNFCFKATGTSGYLSLEIGQAYFIRGENSRTIAAKVETRDDPAVVEVERVDPGEWQPVGVGQSRGDATILELRFPFTS